MTEKEDDVNPSKRSQKEEDSIIWKLQEQIKVLKALYETEHRKTFHWHNEEWEMRKKKNEWKLFSLTLIIVVTLLKIMNVI